jgi:SAM-dependent methyltransferase
VAAFQQGDATALPFSDNRFDAAVMALVIFFVPDPAKGVAEMVRVVGPGGIVSAYVVGCPGRRTFGRAYSGRDARDGDNASTATKLRGVATGIAAGFVEERRS